MAKSSRAISLRIKFLLVLTLIPLVVLAAYLALAIEVFQSDKIAYVFEQTSSISRTLSAQANAEWGSAFSSARPILQDWTENQSFGPVSQSLISNEGPLQWVAVFEKDAQGIIQERTHVQKSGSDAKAELALLQVGPAWFQKFQGKNRVVMVPFHDERVYILETVNLPTEGQQLFFIIQFKSKGLMEAFLAPGGTENFLIDPTGEILLGPSTQNSGDLRSSVPLPFLLNPESNIQSGTEEVNNTQDEKILISYSKVGFGNLFIVSVVPKKAALAAVQTLIRKSLIFFALLICVTLMISLVASKNLTATLTQLFLATQKVSQGNFNIRVPVTSQDEVGSLAKSFNKMAEEVSRLLSETAEKARMQAELQTAQTVQETLFPPVSAEIGTLQVTGYYEPASECGGDWWHYNWVNEKVFLWIGDATGHGAPAALITSAAKSASTIIESLQVEPASALNLLNRSIYDVSRGRIMMTFFLACFDPKTRVLTYANASHESPFLIKKSDSPPKKRDLIPLNEVNNPRLGQSRDTTFEQTSVQLGPGDRILFYTDGIPDIQNKKTESWGEREFLKAVLVANADFPPVNEAVARLSNKFQEFRQNAPLIDDITFFMVEVKES